MSFQLEMNNGVATVVPAKYILYVQVVSVATVRRKSFSPSIFSITPFCGSSSPVGPSYLYCTTGVLALRFQPSIFYIHRSVAQRKSLGLRKTPTKKAPRSLHFIDLHSFRCTTYCMFGTHGALKGFERVFGTLTSLHSDGFGPCSNDLQRRPCIPVVATNAWLLAVPQTHEPF